MTPEQRFRHLRAVTARLRRIRGMGRLLEVVRRHYGRQDRLVLVPDFDGTIRMEVRLSEHMGSQVFWYGSYSPEVLCVLDRLLQPGMVVVDAGANIGEVSLYSAKRVRPNGRVFSFEPVTALAARLRHHVSLNGFRDVEVVESGLAEREGTAELYGPGGLFRDGTVHAGLATLYPNSERGKPIGTIPLTTLDAFARARRLERIDVLKVDVEGAELPLLRGAREVLATLHPWLIIEVQEETSGAAGYHQRDILEYLGDLGYDFARIGRGGRLAAISVDQLDEFQNVLGIPPGRTVPGRS